VPGGTAWSYIQCLVLQVVRWAQGSRSDSVKLVVTKLNRTDNGSNLAEVSKGVCDGKRTVLLIIIIIIMKYNSLA
jgi:hypothetical protein